MTELPSPTLIPPTALESLFCASLPQMPRAWDSTMLGLLKECPRKFYLTIIQEWQSPGFAAHLVFGIAYHKALELYDDDRARGLGFDEAQLNAIRFCMNYGERDELGRFQAYDAMFTREPAKTRETLLRAVIWYLEQFRNDPARTVILANGEPAVELTFKIHLEMETPDGDPFLLCGHIDRLVEIDEDYWYLDRKTTKGSLDARYFKQFTPNNQMSLYHMASQVLLDRPTRGGLIDAAELGANYVRFRRHPIHRTTGQISEWIKDTYLWIGQALQFATEGYWPMNDKSCGNYGGCPFRDVCSRDPKVRDIFLEKDGYLKRKWNPLEAR